MSEPLWSDEQIRKLTDPITHVVSDDHTGESVINASQVNELFEIMRDDYEGYVAELERALAERWQPLEPGRYDAQHEGDSFEIDRDYLKVRDRNILDDSIDEVEIGLPEEIRVCRLTKGEEHARL